MNPENLPAPARKSPSAYPGILRIVLECSSALTRACIEKEFIGKDDIKARKVEHIKNIVTDKTKISKKESITSDETTITQLKPIVSQVTNDEWKSF